MKSKIREIETHKKLNRDKTNAAVINLVKELNLWGGSNGDISLYDLIGTYLLNPESRKPMNVVAEKYRVKTL